MLRLLSALSHIWLLLLDDLAVGPAGVIVPLGQITSELTKVTFNLGFADLPRSGLNYSCNHLSASRGLVLNLANVAH